VGRKAVGESDPQSALTSLLGLVRVGDKMLQPKILSALEKIDWAALNHTQKLELMRVYQRSFIRMGHPDAATTRKVAVRFEAVFPATSREMNIKLAQMLIYLDSPEAVAKSMALLAKAPEWTVAELAPVLEKGLKSGRDFDRGRQMFGVTSYFMCHRYDGEGGAFGPDLTQLAGRFSTNDLLEAIIEPSKAISDQYAPVMSTKKDGKNRKDHQPHAQECDVREHRHVRPQ
jgi:hypothetical protein